MGRNRKKIDEQGDGEKLLTQLRKEPAGWRRERMLALKLVMEGRATQSVAD